MAGKCEGSNEPPNSLKATNLRMARPLLSRVKTAPSHKKRRRQLNGSMHLVNAVSQQHPLRDVTPGQQRARKDPMHFTLCLTRSRSGRSDSDIPYFVLEAFVCRPCRHSCTEMKSSPSKWRLAHYAADAARLEVSASEMELECQRKWSPKFKDFPLDHGIKIRERRDLAPGFALRTLTFGADLDSVTKQPLSRCETVCALQRRLLVKRFFVRYLPCVESVKNYVVSVKCVVSVKRVPIREAL
ncbi:hypothetical protein ANN_01922 [Periplaneta americana]|uniref:Uncharacterized protein n=1 Tax=Periplaneta americana TaxID=6978 RepID=A0ABQ8TZ09_PERAM|nr:hypothetical protein ANN_01922 [Periplaneta americana]